MIHPGRIIKLRVRGTKKDLIQETSSEEVCVVMTGVIARFDGSEIKVYVIFSARFYNQYYYVICHVCQNNFSVDPSILVSL